MKTIFQKWWENDNKQFSIINYKRPWREVGNKPRLDFFTNGAIKGADSCLDVHLIIGYTFFNYTNFNFSGKRCPVKKEIYTNEQIM
jgi:hypothetical protein